MKNRLHQLRQILKNKQLDGLLITHDPNIHYLTGFPAKESWLLVGLKGVFYITDFRYMLEAQKGVKGARVVQYTGSLTEKLFECVKAQKIKRLAFEENHVSFQLWRRLREETPKGCTLLNTLNLVESLRERKEEEEIRRIKAALKVHEASFRYLKRIVRPGLTELEIVLKLEQFVKSRGVGFSFDPIVASGPNSCFPHAKVTQRRVRPNDVVLIDWGIDHFGYKSDLTRMFFLGRIPKLIQTVNDTVVQAQQKAIDFIRADVPIAQVDYQARNYLKGHKIFFDGRPFILTSEARKDLNRSFSPSGFRMSPSTRKTAKGLNYLEGHQLAKYFGHALGHGVGLEIHESPRISQRNNDLLSEGMVITVEPAVYIPNKFGIRIEDMVLVREKKAEVLSAHIY